MFGYVKFNVKYYILSQIFYNKKSDDSLLESMYPYFYYLTRGPVNDVKKVVHTNFISKHTKSELFWPIPPLKQKSA